MFRATMCPSSGEITVYKLFLILLSYLYVVNRCRANECHSRKRLGYFLDGNFASGHYRPDDVDDDKVDLSLSKQ